MLAAAGVWLLLTGIHMGSFIRTPVWQRLVFADALTTSNACVDTAEACSRCNVLIRRKDHDTSQTQRKDVEGGCEARGSGDAANTEELVWFTEIADEHDALRRQILALQTQKVSVCMTVSMCSMHQWQQVDVGKQRMHPACVANDITPLPDFFTSSFG